MSGRRQARLLLVLLAAAALAARPAAAQGVQATPSGDEFTVASEPASLFGPKFPDAGVGGVLRLGDPVNGCGPLTFNKGVSKPTGKWVALMVRTRVIAPGVGCRFQVKVNHAEEAGASAAIIFNDGPEEDLITMGSVPNTKEPDIPSVFVSSKSARAMINLLLSEGGDRTRVFMEGRKTTVWLPKQGDDRVPASPPEVNTNLTAPLPPTKAPGRTFVLSGSSDEIVKQWPATMARMAPGDGLYLKPDGGVLELSPTAAPLVVTAPVLVSGLPFGGASPAPGAPRGAGGGAASVKCLPGVPDAIWIRSPSAVLQDLEFTGCHGFAVVIKLPAPPASGPAPPAAVYPRDRPAVLRRLTLDANEAALLVEDGAAAALDACSFTKNGAFGAYGYAAIWAYSGTVMRIYNTEFTANANGGIWFEGEDLVAEGCLFADNRKTALKTNYKQAPAALYTDPPAPQQLFGLLRVARCEFRNNTYTAGGGLYVGKDTVALVDQSKFSNNSADFGGAMAVAEGGWLSKLSRSSFDRNEAHAYGGAVFVYAHGCTTLRSRGADAYVQDNCYVVIDKVVMTQNTARADGGALYVEASPSTFVNVTDSEFEENTAKGLPAEDVTYADMWSFNFHAAEVDRATCAEGGGAQPPGWGGALYFSFVSSGNAHLHRVSLRRNSAGDAGGALHLCGKALGETTMATLSLVNCTLVGNSAGRGDNASAVADKNVHGEDVHVGGGGDEEGEAGEAGGAAGDGGALHVLGQYLVTSISGCEFSRNRAARGGAVSWKADRGAFGLADLELVNRLYNEDGMAAASGPVGSSTYFFSGWPLSNWPMLYANRTSLPRGSPSRFSGNVAASGAGGALALRGSGCAYLLIGPEMRGNAAGGGGGAVSVDAAYSAVLFTGVYESNAAGAPGGGALLAGGPGVNATVTNAKVSRNRARGPGAAGGGACIRRAASAALEGSTFEGNSAAEFGGGAAILRAAGDAVVAGCEFKSNLAGPPAPAASGSAGDPASARRRSLLQWRRLRQAAPAAPPGAAAADAAAADDAAATAVPPGGGGGAAGAANVTGDDMLYRGGGALYASAAGTVVIGDTAMRGNAGTNGGGAIIRTDLCAASPPPPGRAPANGTRRCLVLLGLNQITGNEATSGIGGGLLVTNASVAFTSCGPAGDARAFLAPPSNKTAPPPPLVPLRACLAKAGPAAINGTGTEAELKPLGLPYGNNARDSDTDDLASIVARLVISCAATASNALASDGGGCAGAAGGGNGSATGSGGGAGVAALTAPPGAVIQAVVAVEDWQGSKITSGTDAMLMLQARVYEGDEWRPDITTLGNVTSSRGGAGRFAGLQLIADPGQYEVRFTPLVSGHQDVAPAVLFLNVRHCVAGESNTSARAGADAGGALGRLTMCERCRQGAVSLDPFASGGCVLCDANLHARCAGDAIIPDDGWWQSHPRSPLVHRCLLPAACNHSRRGKEMQAWASARANETVDDMGSSYLEYTAMQCAQGYQGTLCGECADGFGRRGHKCVKCMQRPLNSFLYFMSLSWVGVLICMSAVFHMKQVSQRRGERLAATANAFAPPVESATVGPPLEFITTQGAPGSPRITVVNSAPSGRAGAGAGAGGARKAAATLVAPASPLRRGGSGGDDISVDIDLAGDLVPDPSGSLPLPNLGRADSGNLGREPGPGYLGLQGRGDSLRSRGSGTVPESGPASGLSATSAGAPHSGLSATDVRPPASAASGSRHGTPFAAAPSFSGPSRRMSAIQKMFSSDIRADSLAHAQLPARPPARGGAKSSATLAAPAPLALASSVGPRAPPAGGLGGAGGVNHSAASFLGDGSITEESSFEEAPREDALNGTGSVANGGGDHGGGPGRPKAQRFWLSNTFKLLITHLQMLGLLRGIRLDWPGGMDQVMGYFDQSQSISFWVVLECSFATKELNGLRPSIYRMFVLLLLPAAAGLVALGFWLLCAAFMRLRFRGQRGAGHLVSWSYYAPRVVMSLGLIMFYMYPQVADAVVSILVACTPLDNPAKVAPAFLPVPGTEPPGGGALAALKAVGLYWNLDTHYQCFDGPMRWLMAMGVVWAVAFCVGFPVAMAAVLAKNKWQLSDPGVDLKYGFFYDSYRLKFYYWESVLLVEKLVLALVVTATQRFGAPSQVLAAQCTFFLALVLQGKAKPYGCRMLDTLQSGSLYALTGTAFALMMPALDSVLGPSIGADEARSKAVTGAALGVMALLNLGVIGACLFAMALEAKRMVLNVLDHEGKGHVTWGDVTAFLRARLPAKALAMLGLAPRGGGGGGAAGASGGGAWGGPPAERVPGADAAGKAS